MSSLPGERFIKEGFDNSTGFAPLPLLHKAIFFCGYGDLRA